MTKRYAILLLAGYSQRRKEKEKKQYALLDGKERFLYPLDTFLESNRFTKIILVIQKENEERIKEKLLSYPQEKILLCYGGNNRSESVYNGYQAVKKLDPSLSYLYIHDGDRPFVSLGLLSKLKEKEKEYDAITPILPLYDSLLKKEGEDILYLDRRDTYKVSTPQVFVSKVLDDILNERRRATDEFQLALNRGYKVTEIIGEKQNFKITDQEDRKLAKRLSIALNKEKKFA